MDRLARLTEGDRLLIGVFGEGVRPQLIDHSSGVTKVGYDAGSALLPSEVR
jgi:hypothetical protein